VGPAEHGGCALTAAVTGSGLREWVAAVGGGPVQSWELLAAGNSRSLVAARVATARGPVEVVARSDDGDGPFSGTELTLPREAAVYRALGGVDVRTPRLLGVDEDRRRMLLSREPGTADWSDEVLDGLLAELGRLHAVDVGTLDLPEMGRCARDDLELWARIAARTGPPSPLVELAFAVLRDHFPGEPERIVLCHGDAGPGNVLQRDGRVTALLDWEFAHLGDPVDDLAWITARALLHGLQLPGFAERVRAEYEPRAGVVVDPDRLAYWQAVTLLRNLVSCHAALANPVRGRDRLLHLMLMPGLERLVVGALADLEGVALRPTPAPAGPDDLPGGEVLREIAAALDDLLGSVADADAHQRGRRMRLLLRQFAQTWVLAPDIARAEQAMPPAPDRATRLQQLADAAEHRIALFPRTGAIGHHPLATMEGP